MNFQGNAPMKRVQLNYLNRNFEVLKMKQEKFINDYFEQLMTIAINMRNYGEDKIF